MSAIVKGGDPRPSDEIWENSYEWKQPQNQFEIFVGFGRLTPKPEVLATDSTGGSVASKETYRMVKRSRRYLEKWPRYRGPKKFVLRLLADDGELLATDSSQIPVGGHGGYVPP